MFPTEMFETRTQRKVLRVLAEKNKRYTIEELAELCHRSEATVSRALNQVDRYPFIEKQTVTGTRRLAFGLNPESRYTAAIREFFQVEREIERQNGTVPVDIWNRLEDISHEVSSKLDSFVELFLFGSYATGEYYAGSDIDLLLVHTSEETSEINQLIQDVGSDLTHVLQVTVDKQLVEKSSDSDLISTIKARSPVDEIEVMIPLTGEVKTR